MPARPETKPTKKERKAPEAPTAAPITPVASPLRPANHFWAQLITAGYKKAVPSPTGAPKPR